MVRHAGVNCADCHRADNGDPDTMDHNGYLISTLVTPKDCTRCHQKEVNEQKGSHHATAGQILASADNYLGEVVGGAAAVTTGCWQCHGSTIKVLPGASSTQPRGQTPGSVESLMVLFRSRTGSKRDSFA